MGLAETRQHPIYSLLFFGHDADALRIPNTEICDRRRENRNQCASECLPLLQFEATVEGEDIPNRECGFRRMRPAVPIECGQRFRSIADTIPMTADRRSHRRQ
jgi:hypothetical protein